MHHDIVVTATFGLESVVADELAALGCSGLSTADRRVRFAGSVEDIARCNLWLRAADRVLLLLGAFPAPDFDALFEGVRSAPWRDVLPRRAAVRVEARSARSRLASVPAIQSAAMKAIVEALGGGRLPEDGPRITADIELKGDVAEVLLDTSGEGLHKRGYRSGAGAAPLRENLAAALVLLSRWDARRPFADPLCGSGTIAIEAALIGRRIAPGIGRSFAGEALLAPAGETWARVREEARAQQLRGTKLSIVASDRDGAVLARAREGAERAGVADAIRLERRSLEAFVPDGEFGCIVTNPPYGERLGGDREVEALYRSMGRLYRKLPTWSWFVLTAHPGFTRLFGARESRNRKLYNGNLRCWLHQYFGPLPPSIGRPSGIPASADPRPP